MKKYRHFAALAFNLAGAVLGMIGLVMAVWNSGAGLLRFYTELSNIFAIDACAVYAAAEIMRMASGRDIPTWVRVLKFMATCCLAITLIVVVAVLAPTAGPNGYRNLLLRGDMLYHHLLCPVLAIVSTALFEEALPKRAPLISLIPTALYAAVTVPLNAAGRLDGPYPFLRVRSQSVRSSLMWAAAIFGGAYLIAWVLHEINRVTNK